MWQYIRTLGELQILSRASYTMLIVVPLLAAIWPAIRVSINRYNTVVAESKEALESASQRLEFIISTYTGDGDASPQFTQVIENLRSRLKTILEEKPLKTIKSDRLPSVWALSFLASLAVIIGHLIYQLWAPELIRRTTLKDYINESLQLFTATQIQRTIQMDEKSREEEIVKARELLQTNLTMTDWAAEHISELNRPESQRRRDVNAVKREAQEEYQTQAKAKLIVARFCAAFYAVALLLILWIIVTQTYNVLTAAWG